MRAAVLTSPQDVSRHPLRITEVEKPGPQPGLNPPAAPSMRSSVRNAENQCALNWRAILISIVRTIIVLVVIVVVSPALLLAFSAIPVVNLPDSLTALGQATPITVQVSDPHGIRRIAVLVEQDGARYRIWEESQPSRRLLWRRRVADSTWNFTAGTGITPQLHDGPARLIVEATSNDLRGTTARSERDLVVVTRPPTLSVDSEQHYLYLGMSDLVTFNVAGSRSARLARLTIRMT